MALYPELEPHDRGMLEVGDGHAVYWEVSGNPAGKPAIVLHGGPGAPSGPRHRRFFDPAAYRIVLLHQRGCGRSTPHAGGASCDLRSNTTTDLLSDLERLRRHLGIDAWLLLGGSWGSALALAYALDFPARVTELVLLSVFLGLRSEIDWVFGGGLGARRPEAWARLKTAIGNPPDDRVVEVAHAMLCDPDPTVHGSVAYEWCLWESSIVDPDPTPVVHPVCRDSASALAFARIVTHYGVHDMWLGDGLLLERAPAVTVPTVLVNGRDDLQAARAVDALASRLPAAESVWIDGAGHSGREEAFVAEVVRATDRFRPHSTEGG